MQNKTKLLLGSASVSAVVAGVALTGGTSAYYYDLERSEGNSLAACSLDLVQQSVTAEQIDKGAYSQATGSWSTSPTAGGLSSVTLSNLQPGDKFKLTAVLKNEGSCAGELWADINFPIEDLENGILEPEKEPGVPDPDTTGGAGDLDDVIVAAYSDTASPSNSFNGSYHQLAYLPPEKLDGDFTAGEVHTITLVLSVPDDGTPRDGQEIMGDSYTFAIDFAAAQKGKVLPNTDLNR